LLAVHFGLDDALVTLEDGEFDAIDGDLAGAR
jgi:hypothetical protein